MPRSSVNETIEPDSSSREGKAICDVGIADSAEYSTGVGVEVRGVGEALARSSR